MLYYMQFTTILKKCSGVPVWCSGLSIQCCHCSGWGLCCGKCLIPAPGCFTCRRHGQKKKKKVGRLFTWVDTKMAPCINESSRTNFHKLSLAHIPTWQPVRWTGLSSSLSGMTYVASHVWNPEVGGFKVSCTSMIPELFLPLPCCVILDKPLPLSGPWWPTG